MASVTGMVSLSKKLWTDTRWRYLIIGWTSTLGNSPGTISPWTFNSTVMFLDTSRLAWPNQQELTDEHAGTKTARTLQFGRAVRSSMQSRMTFRFRDMRLQRRTISACGLPKLPKASSTSRSSTPATTKPP